MHHVALDRSGADDGDLDDEIVVVSAACSRGSIDICARDSIWNTPTVSARRDHLVDARIFGGYVGKLERPPTKATDQRQRAPDGREHAEPQHIDLEQAADHRDRPCPTG